MSVIVGHNSEDPKTQCRNYSAQISEDGLLILQGLIGRQLHRVLAPCLQVAGMHFTAPSFSIQFSDEIAGKWFHNYANIRCEWSETPLTHTDFWSILVSCEDKPFGIDVASNGATMAPCTVSFYNAKPIRKIEVYEHRWSDERGGEVEAVRYDQAIRFEQEGGAPFCIACQLNGPGIATELHISESESTVSEFLEGSRLRVCIPAK
jgi:hypothetical protein